MCSNYTLCVRSQSRWAGNASEYSVTVPQIPKGLYKATFSMAADNTVIQELRVRWGQTNSFDTESIGYVTVLTLSYDAQNCIYVTNPPNSMDVQVLDSQTGALYDNEHQILIHLERL
jgi:hypothetical protein